MLFNSVQFAAFFLLVWVGARMLPARTRAPWLLGASLVFYALWVPVYLALLGVTVLVNYGLLRIMVRSVRPKLPLAASIVFTLGLLAVFKYAAFIVSSALPVLRWSIGWEPPIPEFFLPLGISFYSFQMIALSVDTYQRRMEPVSTLRRYALFVCFFPQLIAGPIVRGHELLPQLERGAVTTSARTQRGLWLLASGLVKKVLLADYLLAPFVDTVFQHPGLASAPYKLLAVYSFAFQIYFDFSGYTDLARGCGLLLGFELPFNFKEPYLSRNPTEFWRRWHMTLSSWLRDYLYIPLGGNRQGRARTGVNVILTMLLGGLWHGASWTFVIWGGLHGVMLMAHRILTRRRRLSEDAFTGGDWLRALLLFHAVCVLWIFFRAPTLEIAWSFLGGIFGGNYLVDWPVFRVASVFLCVFLHVLERWARQRAPGWQRVAAQAWWGPAAEGLALGTIAGLALMASGGTDVFIYFQF